ncbi:hypothetical protein PVAP13_2NG510203 [Panicum virgatum]|uniref:Uncharacterized protein n=1 Tax=Panicum virgatum TaxID=38727 RepID=A0A8T0VM49_PANVG|nr:hypothetical protein PVAP13_2NG510203 [Panicum virgatum]
MSAPANEHLAWIPSTRPLPRVPPGAPPRPLPYARPARSLSSKPPPYAPSMPPPAPGGCRFARTPPSPSCCVVEASGFDVLEQDLLPPP